MDRVLLCLQQSVPSPVYCSSDLILRRRYLMDTGTGAEAPRQQIRQPMNSFTPRSRPEPEIFATDMRPGADAFVYCKGCGVSLPGQARYQRAKAAITTMMCEECQIRHGHALMPMPGT